VWIAVISGIADMVRYLIWIEGDADGWACSNCRWRFPVPTLLGGGEAKAAYDRLADLKFREHVCEGQGNAFAARSEPKPSVDSAFTERARALIKRGYTPKVAVELVLQEMETEYGSHSKTLEKARQDAEDFLRKVKQGLI